MEYTLTTALLVLLVLQFGTQVFQTSYVAASRISQVRGGHPTDFLTSAGHQGHARPEDADKDTDADAEVREMTRQLMQRLTARGADPKRLSVQYIVELFEKLERGDGMAEATGVMAKSLAGIADADIIKGIAPSISKRRRHKADITLNFRLSGLTGSDQTELAELRIRPLTQHPADASRSRRPAARPSSRRGGIQRVRVSILDKDGDRQVERIYRVRWRLDQRDDFEVLDITKILQEMVASGTRRFQNGSLEISLRKTRRHRGIAKETRSSSSRKVRSVTSKDNAMIVMYSKSAPSTLVDDVVLSLSQKPLVESAMAAKRNAAITAATAATTDTAATAATGSTLPAVAMHHRERRGARKQRKKTRCAPKDLFVDFETLGWADDIIFPTRYNARACSGRCPSPVNHKLHPTNHAILQSMMRLHDRQVARPCCVPVSLKPLMMLYKLADGNIEIRHHPDMVVDKCGCR